MASSVSDTAASGSSGRSSTSRCSPPRDDEDAAEKAQTSNGDLVYAFIITDERTDGWMMDLARRLGLVNFLLFENYRDAAA